MERVRVEIIESEGGRDTRFVQWRRFNNLEDAEKFIDAFNAGNDDPDAPDCYMYARITV